MNAVPATTPSAPPAAESERTLATRMAGVAAYLDQLRRTNQRGTLAELRRLRPETVPGDAFWSLVDRYEIPRSEEAFWLAVLPLMVRHPHQRGVRPGKALEAAGISKARFERWLRLDRDAARREAARLFSKLKDQGFDWISLGHALRHWSEANRYELARDFFLARERREPTSTDGAD
jgi:hypothetical protein